MSLERFWEVADRARSRRRLDAADAAFVRDALPRAFADLDRGKRPGSIRHPAGFSVTGASVGTFIRSALLLAGQGALGRRYGGSPFYEEVEKHIAFGMMRSHFHRDFPKGTYCCATCTLAVYPVLAADAIRYFDCDPLAADVRQLIERRKWRFARPVNAAMVRWSLGK